MSEEQQNDGNQRLSVERLQSWEELEYGMFIHYGLNTFASAEGLGEGDHPISLYNPTDLDVDQWVRVAQEAGMKYIIMNAKHTRAGGFSMWPTEQSDFSVANAPENTDVIGEFVKACDKYDIRPALYLGSDKHNLDPGDQVTGPTKEHFRYVTRRFLDFTMAQLEELLTWYGPIEEVWFDGPQKYGPAGRRELTEHIESLQPETVITMNGDWENNGGQTVIKTKTWPCDVHAIEAGVPPIWGSDNSWRSLQWDWYGNGVEDPRMYYVPIENCTIAHQNSYGWWWGPDVQPRSLEELLGIRLLCHARNANCVFNVTPSPEGKIPEDQARRLVEVREEYEGLMG